VQFYLGFYLAFSIADVSAYSAALLVGLPFPLDGLQIVFIAFIARHFPSFFLIFNPPAENIMTVAPRRKDAPVFPRAYVKWVLLPYAAAWALVMGAGIALNTWMQTGFILNSQIVGTAKFEAVKNHVAACEYAGHYVEDVGYVEDKEPFHCRCEMRTALWSVPTVSEQGSVSSSVRECTAREGIEKWCWSGNVKPNTIEMADNCGVIGMMHVHAAIAVAAATAQTLFMISQSNAEVWLFSGFGKNIPMTVASFLGIGIVLAGVYWPFAASLLGFVPPNWQVTVLAVVMGLIPIVVVELTKIGYRSESEEYNALRIFHAEAARSGLVSSLATDAEVMELMQSNPDLKRPGEQISRDIVDP
jgi:magnesium-transporting ATPase (P-type)